MDDTGGEMGRETEDRVALETIPLHSANLLTVLDKAGTITYESPSIERLFGFDPQEPVGANVADYFHPEDREEVRKAFQSAVESTAERTESAQYRHQQADGSYRWVESVASSTPTPEGYYIVNTRDISDQKEREQQLHAKNDRLAQFASVVSHNLRNPLTVASGHLEAAIEESESEHHEPIASSLERMELLIDDLLALARGGKQVADVESVDLATESQRCWKTVSTAGASLVTDIERSIQADRSRVAQLLENLMRNAVSHGGETVTITVGELEGGDGFYLMDDGVGIGDTNHEAIFERGFTTAPEGTGFGLTIVREIAAAHGWEVTVTDGESGGARFEFTGVEFV